jgi:HNH endonuclease
MNIRIPRKPFANYKWRWAVYTPTESLNSPPVFLGILRVLRENEFENFSSEPVNVGLQRVQEEMETTVNLVRTQERNIFRNSGQYWKGLGLFQESRRGQIVLSNFGRKLADGEITQIEFAITIVKSLELPNRNIDANFEEWYHSSIRIKPLELILEIIKNLQIEFGVNEGFVTPEELIRIIIPLAGDNGTKEEYINCISLFRQNKLDLTGWPDCAESSNDKRMAREFLLYLSNYGFCNAVVGKTNFLEKYYLSNISIHEIEELSAFQYTETELDRIERIIRNTQIPANIERKKVVREVLDRPNQNLFRKVILEVYQSTCLITGVRLDTVLEAAHIKPVKYKGTDEVYNGICLRADIHTLFDSNHLRIKPNGELFLSEEARKKDNYESLPKEILLPGFINTDYLDWRLKYY